MKTLKILQTLAKIGKILSKIIFILSLVGGILCAVGICCYALIPSGVKIGGVTIKGIISEEAGISKGNIYAALFAGTVFCASEAVLAKLAADFFKFELETGTPFDTGVSKKLLDLGIKVIWIPIVASIAATVGYAVFGHYFKGVNSSDIEGFTQVGLGIMFIITSLILKAATENGAGKRPE